jgi:hypothetical protein
MSPRARKKKEPVPPVLIRMTKAKVLAWYESQAPTNPGNILWGSEALFEVRVYADLAAAEPEPVSPEVRELFIGALAEALVAAYRRDQKNDLASRAALALSGNKEEHR